MDKLECQIEQQRRRLYQAVGEKENPEDVIRISRNLDQLLNKWERMKKK